MTEHIPDPVREWLEFGLPPDRSIETKPLSEIEGTEIITGTVGKALGEEIQEFVEQHSEEDYLIVTTFDNRDEWGSLAIAFTSRPHAETFQRLAREHGGSLRLSAAEEDGWFLYEAE